MTEISFYHLTIRPIEWVLPRLLERTLEVNARAVVILSSLDRVAFFNSHFWTYDQNSWLPHGSEKNGDAENQPIWLTTIDERPNGATFLFLTDGASSNKISEYERVFELFDGKDEKMIQLARQTWKIYKDLGHELSYWQQDELGKWKKQKIHG